MADSISDLLARARLVAHDPPARELTLDELIEAERDALEWQASWECPICRRRGFPKRYEELGDGRGRQICRDKADCHNAAAKFKRH